MTEQAEETLETKLKCTCNRNQLPKGPVHSFECSCYRNFGYDYDHNVSFAVKDEQEESKKPDKKIPRSPDFRTYSASVRKEYPLCTGVLDYFPDALMAIAHVSYVGNEQHNPGERLHWARGKSNDQSDAEARHLLQRGGLDKDGVRHSAKRAWRALADLQLEIERDIADANRDNKAAD